LGLAWHHHPCCSPPASPLSCHICWTFLGRAITLSRSAASALCPPASSSGPRRHCRCPRLCQRNLPTPGIPHPPPHYSHYSRPRPNTARSTTSVPRPHCPPSTAVRSLQLVHNAVHKAPPPT